MGRDDHRLSGRSRPAPTDMKIRMTKTVRVSANAFGSDTRLLRVRSVNETNEGWEIDLFERLVDADLAKEVKVIKTVPETADPVPVKKTPARRRRK